MNIELDHRVVLFNIIHSPVRRRLKALILILVNLGKCIIWNIRGKFMLENRHFSPAEISALTLGRIRHRIRTEQYLMSGADRFFSFWVKEPSVVTIKTNNTVKLLLPH